MGSCQAAAAAFTCQDLKRLGCDCSGCCTDAPSPSPPPPSPSPPPPSPSPPPALPPSSYGWSRKGKACAAGKGVTDKNGFTKEQCEVGAQSLGFNKSAKKQKKSKKPRGCYRGTYHEKRMRRTGTHYTPSSHRSTQCPSCNLPTVYWNTKGNKKKSKTKQNLCVE